MKNSFVVFILLMSATTAFAQTSSNWQGKKYHVLVNGNELYASCGVWKRMAIVSDDNITFKDIPEADLFKAGQCWGYILAVVDSMPVGEGFRPDPSVRATQYIDVVFARLRDHPELRHRSAYGLTRRALEEAFPNTPNPK